MRLGKRCPLRGGLILPLFLFLIWWLGAEHDWWNSFLLPSPANVGLAFVSAVKAGELQTHVAASLLRITYGFCIAALLALTLALFCAWFPALMRQLNPLMEFLRHIPPISVVPILILWFGLGEAPKIILIILATFFPVFMNAQAGIKDCDRQLIEVGKVFRYSRWQIFRFIILPSAIPEILTGLRLGLGYSWRSLVAAELVAASSGLGYMILNAEQLSRSDVVLMGIFVIGALGAILDYGFRVAVRLSFRSINV